ncbi:MAG: hypothetical protein BWY10_00536 [Chloroflexi bacterium ADurb.Bin180]|nr:MAG: hypothetical protein BWY10_00536 [Chloroflexi bacterium ADurb.Bin180]
MSTDWTPCVVVLSVRFAAALAFDQPGPEPGILFSRPTSPVASTRRGHE